VPCASVSGRRLFSYLRGPVGLVLSCKRLVVVLGWLFFEWPAGMCCWLHRSLSRGSCCSPVGYYAGWVSPGRVDSRFCVLLLVTRCLVGCAVPALAS
jgi:hypothetical protein